MKESATLHRSGLWLTYRPHVDFGPQLVKAAIASQHSVVAMGQKQPSKVSAARLARYFPDGRDRSAENLVCRGIAAVCAIAAFA